MGISVDITKQKKLQSELEKKDIELEKTKNIELRQNEFIFYSIKVLEINLYIDINKRAIYMVLMI